MSTKPERACSQERFLKDVHAHTMNVIRDDGVNRHIRFKRPSGSSYWFELVTWPGALCITGDMGTFVFRRLDDMFEFFRTDRRYYENEGRHDAIAINLGYWSEKLHAPSPRAAEEFRADIFESHVKEAFDQWVLTNQPEEDEADSKLQQFNDAKVQLWSELQSEVINCASDGEDHAFIAADQFTTTAVDNFSLEDIYEWDCRDYTFQFIWCCYAISWGIQTYDKVKAAAALPAPQAEGDSLETSEREAV